MLELVRIEDNRSDNVSLDNRTFTLTFLDDQLLEQAWPLLEKEMRKYKNQIDGVIVKSEGFNLKGRYFLKLFVKYPKTDKKWTNEEIDNSLEEIKINFIKYYKSILERIQMIPLLIENEE